MRRRESFEKFMELAWVVMRSILLGLLVMAIVAGIIFLGIWVGMEFNSVFSAATMDFNGATGAIVGLMTTLGFIMAIPIFFITLDSKRLNKKLEESKHGR